MTTHYRVECSVCGTTLAQCRCFDPKKEVRYEVCKACTLKMAGEVTLAFNPLGDTMLGYAVAAAETAELLNKKGKPALELRLEKLAELFRARTGDKATHFFTNLNLEGTIAGLKVVQFHQKNALEFVGVPDANLSV